MFGIRHAVSILEIVLLCLITRKEMASALGLLYSVEQWLEQYLVHALPPWID
jgi:hypothetical protein